MSTIKYPLIYTYFSQTSLSIVYIFLPSSLVNSAHPSGHKFKFAAIDKNVVKFYILDIHKQINISKIYIVLTTFHSSKKKFLWIIQRHWKDKKIVGTSRNY